MTLVPDVFDGVSIRAAWQGLRASPKAAHRLLAAYFVVLLVIVASVLPVLVTAIQTLDRQDALYDPAMAAASQLLTGALNQETGARGFVLTGDAQFLEPFNLGSQQYDAASAALRSLELGQSISQDEARTERSYASWRSLSNQLVAEVRAGNTGQARSSNAQMLGKARFDDFRTQQSRLSAAISKQVVAGRATLKNDVLRSLIILVAAALVGVGVGIGMMIWWRVWGRAAEAEERRLADQGILLQGALDSSSESIFAKDRAGRHILANRARRLALCHDDGVEILGRTVDEFVAAETATLIRATEDEVIASGESRDLEEVLPQTDGPHIFSVTKSPLRDARGQVVGIVGVARDVTRERRLEADRERLHQLEHEFTETIQRAMAGSVEIDDPRVEIAARYQPAHDQLSVGGDWYHAVTVSRDRVALIIGDVVGHGIDSATAMGQLRSALAALAAVTDAPAEALEALDAFANGVARARCSTCLLAYIDFGRDELVFSIAGQMPPLVVPVGAPPYLIEDRQDHPLATEGIRRRRSTTLDFPIGSTIVLYTDGLVEDRVEGIDEGLRRLRAVVQNLPTEPVEGIADRLLEDVARRQGQLDDIAFIVARRMM
jgi:PAS domain S-box-containing protein